MSILSMTPSQQHTAMTALEVIGRHMETLPGDHCPDCFALIEIARSAFICAGGTLTLGAPRSHRDREILAAEWIIEREDAGQVIKLDHHDDDHVHYELSDGLGGMVSWHDVRLELARTAHGLDPNPA